jgi:ABC-type lipoprotein export system ATPase subunit
VAIRRLQVEEGFLNDLDLTFDRGLNVLIGPRGSGKTSIIELIRFCLGVPGMAEKVDAESRQHALSILGPGRVTVTLEIDGEEHVFSRTAEDPTPAPVPGNVPVILSHNEIEIVGLEQSGRLALIDSFIPQAEFSNKQALLGARLRSQTVEVQSLLREIAGIRGQLAERSRAEQQLAEVERQQKEVLRAAAATAADGARLDRLQNAIAAASAQEAVLQRTAAALQRWREVVVAAGAAAPRIEAWPASSAADQLSGVRTQVAQVAKALVAATSQISKVLDEVETLRAAETTNRSRLGDETRTIRRRLEEVQSGAGAIARRVTELRELVGQAAALRALLDDRTGQLTRIVTQRRAAYDEVQALRRRRYAARVAVARDLSDSLGPRVRVTVKELEGLDPYASAIAGALRGSGLHYSTLAPSLADAMSPRELVELVESGRAQELSEASGIPIDRAARVIDSISRAGCDSIITAPIEDAATLELEVAGVYKPTEALSTGQRCTVVLPIVLWQRGRPVLVDQPEDNLDNAYIADAVVPALRARDRDHQLILATHNPNIPVLGDAEAVIVLMSTGAHGEVAHRGRLLEPASVAAITEIMEGGAAAFRKRAALYGIK